MQQRNTSYISMNHNGPSIQQRNTFPNHATTYEEVVKKRETESVYTEPTEPNTSTRQSGDKSQMMGQKGKSSEGDGDSGAVAEYYYVSNEIDDIVTTAAISFGPNKTLPSTMTASTAAATTAATTTVSPNALLTIPNNSKKDQLPQNGLNGPSESDYGDHYLYPISVRLPIQQ